MKKYNIWFRRLYTDTYTHTDCETIKIENKYFGVSKYDKQIRGYMIIDIEYSEIVYVSKLSKKETIRKFINEYNYIYTKVICHSKNDLNKKVLEVLNNGGK